MIYYNSTRGGEKNITASQAILKGLACDGGLFMPDRIPEFDFNVKDLCGKTYQEIAYEVMKLYLTDYTKEELCECIAGAYDEKFDTEEIAPITYADGAYYLELYHGATIAFKDMALSILPHLMTVAAKKNNVSDKIIILTATSGDTGKAAMAGFADVPGTGIIVFFPKGGVSHIQQLQMTTQRGANVTAVAIHGNFDDAQTGVKKIFGDAEFAEELRKKGVRLSSANSINIGRLVPQIVYYVYSYVKLLECGRIGENGKINISVPTGNFGNILAAYMAKCMGLPVDRLICASNDNKVLYDFFETGVYDKNREFVLTDSPSMDILVSSNLERLIYLSSGCDAQCNSRLMESLSRTGEYEVSSSMKDYMRDFAGGYADEERVHKKIKDLYDRTGYVIDTHTGVAAAVYEDYRNRTKDDKVTVIASTASPYKFSKAVVGAITGQAEGDDFEIIDRLSEISNTSVPNAVKELKTLEVRHKAECEKDNMKETVRQAIDWIS
ncbi:MAG: threonine synthase [Lachnospiraceae bacterium]|nr:threonine synthase [Lachnospiraceae bacterium]